MNKINALLPKKHVDCFLETPPPVPKSTVSSIFLSSPHPDHVPLNSIMSELAVAEGARVGARPPRTRSPTPPTTYHYCTLLLLLMPMGCCNPVIQHVSALGCCDRHCKTASFRRKREGKVHVATRPSSVNEIELLVI